MKKHLFLALSLSLLIFTGIAQALSPIDNLEGHYVLIREGKQDTGQYIDLKRISGKKFHVSGFAYWTSTYNPDNVHTGELDHDVTVRSKVFYYSDGIEDYSCHAKVNWKPGKLTVKDNNQCGGMNVTFTGTYIKSKS
ncbi:MAG: hypothetical protein AAB551_01795 [Patescibacteria group bacterium]